ncbi:MAG TPA: Ig-like domain repeat protein, partial [Acidimicrobiales bacterium]|nr:Ig-like domain repeat protein [Acidimicrobiales bacterium]
STYLTVAGGTSFGAPIFAGMLALVNEKVGGGGLGVAASTLYLLAASGTTYASAFHDVTVGGNNCVSGASNCTAAGAGSYLSTTGYDEASGLGSVDFYNLLGVWPGAGTLVSSVPTDQAATTAPEVADADAITITVASGSSKSTAVPTGDVSVAVDGTTAVASLALAGGSASYSYTPATAGTHLVSVTYAGDSTYGPSTGQVTLTAGAAGFTVSAASATVASGSSGTSTVTVTPVHGYTGTITWTVATDPVLEGGCLSLPDAVVSGPGAVTSSLAIEASSSLCGAASMAAVTAAGRPGSRGAGRGPLPARGAGVALAALALALGAALGRRRTPLLVSAAAAAALALAACGGPASTGSGSSTRVAKGTYKVSVVGRDTVTPSITATATMTLTVD